MSRESDLNLRLTQCEEEWGALFPDNKFRFADLSKIPNDKLRPVARVTADILATTRYVDKLLQEAALDTGHQSIAQKTMAFYRNTLLPNQKAMQTLFDQLVKQPGLFQEFETPSTDTGEDIVPDKRPKDYKPLWNMLVTGFDYWSMDESGTFCKNEIEAVERLIFSPFFSPDEWLQNSSEIEPVLGGNTGQRVPGQVRLRLKELTHSFILGNYLASVALARAILEYALVDRAAIIGIRACGEDPRYPDRTNRLGTLIKDASEIRPALKMDMESVWENGNRMLHPKKRDNVIYIPAALREMALESVNAIRHVVEALYLN